MTNKAVSCSVCTGLTPRKHTDADCVTHLIESGLLASAPWFNRKIPPVTKWTDQEHDFAEQLAMQAIRWKKAELKRSPAP